MLISLLPNEILDLTFKQLAPAFRSDALSEVYVFDAPVDLLRLRLVSKRFCRIATPLAWRRVQLKISREDMASLLAIKGRTSWNAPYAGSSQGVGGATSSPAEFQTSSMERVFNRASSNSFSTFSFYSNERLSNPSASPEDSLQFSFFQGHPELAAHVRVLSLIINVEHHAEKSGSGSGSGFGFGSGSDSGFGEFASGIASAHSSGPIPPQNDEHNELMAFDSGFQLGNHNRRNNNSSSSSSLSTFPHRSSFESSHANSTQHLRYIFRAATRGMTGLRTVFVWDAAAPADVVSFSLTQTGVPSPPSSPSRDTTAETIAHEVLSLLRRSRLIKVLSLRDVDGSSFSKKNEYHYQTRTVSPRCCSSSLTRHRHGIKMLHLSNVRHPAQIISSVATEGTLEVLNLEVAGSTTNERGTPGNKTDSLLSTSPTLKDLPWSTLKEVALLHCADDDDWCHFLSGFRLHKSQSQSPLNELLIGDFSGLDQARLYSPTPSYGNRLNHLLTTFHTQRLTKLTLFTLPHLTPLTASRIVRAFPNLRSLTLLTENELAPWQGGVLDDYARIFATLPHLEMLGWNNSHYLAVQFWAEFDYESESSPQTSGSPDRRLAALYEPSVTALVKRAKRLKCIQFISAADCIVDNVFITKPKKSKGGYYHQGYLEHFQTCDDATTMNLNSDPSQRLVLTVRRSNKAALNTSSWDTTSVEFDDII